ncbi:2737_t:CDS:1 [Acaulospora colombiana]|uniref:2737_t:CDS:1 n=1 Tax=Acaulospora colombiana TaxID=27376 RepID=A0ACA9MD97_9GLOM|nr:2737_t:CDS:1 [Acaulospora colombiana]
MGTVQFNNEFGETSEKNARFDNTADRTTGKKGVESEPEIYLLISHGGRKHDSRGGRRIGLFGPFGPRGGPRRIGHPRERHDKIDVRRGPPHARELRREPHFMHNPEKEEFTDGRGYDSRRGRFCPVPHEKREPTLETGSEFHREPRHHGFGPREHRPRGRFETEERIRSPYHHLSRGHGRGPRGGPRGRFETEERIHPPYHHVPRSKFEADENHERGTPSHRHGYRPHGKLHDSRERFETERHVKGFHGKSFPRPYEYGGRNDGPHVGSPSREHGHGPRGKFERELGYHSDHSDHHRHGPGLRDRFEHNRHGSDHGYESDHSIKGRHRGGRKSENDRRESDSECESNCKSNIFEHRRDSHRFDHGRHEVDSQHHSNHILRSHRGGFDPRRKRRLSRDEPRLHRYARGHRHGIFRSRPFPHHQNRLLTPEELAKNVGLLNLMGFTSEDNSHYEELLKKYNGRIGRVVDILLWEQKKKRDDERRDEDDDEGKEDGDEGKEDRDEREREDEEDGDHDDNQDDYDVVEKESDKQS